MIGLHEERGEISYDVPNAFIPTEMPKINEPVNMKITGVLVYLLGEIDPGFFGKYVVRDNRRKVLYVEVLWGIYVILLAYLMWYNKFCSDLEIISS